MSEQSRDASGKFGEKITDQDVLKVFDATDEPFLTSGEIADQLPVSRAAVNNRLNQLQEADRVDRKETGARAIGWWATAAPEPSEETLRDIEATEGELEAGETVSQPEIKRRLGIDG